MANGAALSIIFSSESALIALPLGTLGGNAQKLPAITVAKVAISPLITTRNQTTCQMATPTKQK